MKTRTVHLLKQCNLLPTTNILYIPLHCDIKHVFSSMAILRDGATFNRLVGRWKICYIQELDIAREHKLVVIIVFLSFLQLTSTLSYFTKIMWLELMKKISHSI